MLFSAKERAQGMVEYALIIIMIALVVMVVLVLFGTEVSTLYSKILSSLESL